MMSKPGLAGAALATILALAGSGAAQPNPGDFVVGDGRRIGLVDRTSGRTTTLASFQAAAARPRHRATRCS
jgi:hypothetical protein